MDDGLGLEAVQPVHALRDSLGDVKLLLGGDVYGAVVDDGAEVATLDVLHDDGEVVLLCAHAHEQQDARVPQRSVVEEIRGQ